MSKIKNGGLDQYGAEPFEQQQFGTAGVEGVNSHGLLLLLLLLLLFARNNQAGLVSNKSWER